YLTKRNYIVIFVKQRKILSWTKPIREKVIREFYCMEQPTTTLCIADLGCSSAEQNTLSIVSDLIEIVDKTRRELEHGSLGYQISLNDLQGNDFNTLFRSIRRFNQKLKEKLGDDFGNCFVNGVPGSFYGRLFPNNSLHVVHSSTCLHWLSQVPEGIEDNKNNIFMARTSPANVHNAYYEQFQKDFLAFLHCRAQEVKEGSFTLDHAQVFQVSWEANDGTNESSILNTSNKNDFSTCMRSVLESLIAGHFGEEIIDEVFQRYKKAISVSLDKENNVAVNVIIILTRMKMI
ncbi:Salicylate carboxymethyltransferase, partial [Bienertia sinuspersici]